MKSEQEGLSVSDVLSSIRNAVLETKSNSDEPKKGSKKVSHTNENTEDVFALTADMLVHDSSNTSLSENDFEKISERLLKKYAKIFATWQALEQNKTE